LDEVKEDKARKKIAKDEQRLANIKSKLLPTNLKSMKVLKCMTFDDELRKLMFD
jgi:hypothetical protein